MEQRGLCHSNPLELRETEAVWLRFVCDTTPQADNTDRRVILAPRFLIFLRCSQLSSALAINLCLVLSFLQLFEEHKWRCTSTADLPLSAQKCCVCKGTKQPANFSSFIHLTSSYCRRIGKLKIKNFGQTWESNSNANTSSLVRRQWNSTHGHRVTTKNSLGEVSD